MNSRKDKKDLVERAIPETPTLKDESVKLTGLQRILYDYQMGRIERGALVEQRRILGGTKVQMLEDRMGEIITSYRYQMSLARDAFIAEAEAYANYFINEARVRITDDKGRAVRKACENFADLMIGIRSDLSPTLVDKIQQSAETLLDKTIDEILVSSYDIKKAVTEYYPDKRRK